MSEKMGGSVWTKYGRSSYEKIYTLNFDGSHNYQAKKAGAGCIIRDSHGELVVAAAYNLSETYSEYCDVAIAEAVALRNGLSLAKENNLRISLIKGDNKEVIDHVLGCRRRKAKFPLSKIIQEITGMIDLSSQRIVIVDREGNKVADKLAFWGCHSTEHQGGRMNYSTDADLPAEVAELIKQEMLGTRREELDVGEGTSMATNIGMASAIVAGVAILFWGVSKLVEGITLIQHTTS